MLKRDGRAMVDHLLDDPIVDLILARDGITRADVLRVMETARRARVAGLALGRALDPALEPAFDRAA